MTRPRNDDQSLLAFAWPCARAAEALHAAATQAHLDPRPLADVAIPPATLDRGRNLARWIEAVGRTIGVALEPVETTYGEIDSFLRHGAPAIIRLDAGHLLAIVGANGGTLHLLPMDRRVRRVPLNVVKARLAGAMEQPHRSAVDRLLSDAGLRATRLAAARTKILADRLARHPLGDAWLIRLTDSAPLGARLRRSRIPRRAVALLVAHALEYGLGLVAWTLLGHAVLSGRLDPGWLAAWLLLLVTVVPLHALRTWLAGALTVEAGGLMRRRLLAGALRLEPEETRHQGVGQVLGRVLEAESIDGLALGGGLSALTAAVEVAIVLGALAAAGLWWLGALLVAWIALVTAWGWRLFARQAAWTDARLTMTHALIERMVGHRTRQAQEPVEAWHSAEDQALAAYLESSRAMDATAASLDAIAERGWIVASLAALLPQFVNGTDTSTIAIALGCIVLGAHGVRRIAAGASQIAGAVIAWRQIAPFWNAANREPPCGTSIAAAVATAAPPGGKRDQRPVLQLRDIVFRHDGRAEPVFSGVDLVVHAGDRLLVQGPSGAGKSTLAALVVGLRNAQQGLTLLDGLDLGSLGSHTWRRRVTAAPQFHENHVLGGTLLFNVLMGTDLWPPGPEDLARIDGICRELGLDDLVDRMPSGLFQLVGETGWQLSHGERSRLFIARALAQDSDVMVLDESFAALDPENMERALECVLRRARTLVVIAHP